MKYRSRLDIIAVVLESIGGGSKKTKILYEAYLSYKQVGSYLAFLLEKELVAFEPDQQLYRLTENGRLALSFIEDLEKLVGVNGSKRAEFYTDHHVAVGPEQLHLDRLGAEASYFAGPGYKSK